MKHPATTRAAFVIPALFLGLFLTSSLPLAAQTANRGVFLWMLNNEAQCMGILATDRQLMDKMSTPFGLFGWARTAPPQPELSLWTVHLKFFSLLEDLGDILTSIQTLQKRNLRKDFENVFPGNASVRHLTGTPVMIAQKLGPVFEKEIRMTLLRCLGINKLEDADFSGRVDAIIKSLADPEKRLLMSYLEMFSALYTKDSSGKIFSSLLRDGIKRDFTGQLLGRLKGFSQRVSPTVRPEIDAASDAELSSFFEKEVESASETAEPTGTSEPTSQPTDDVFNILN